MKTFCISIYNENYSFFKKNNLTPVGLGKIILDKEWINDKFENDISSKKVILENIHFIIDYGKIPH